MTYDIKFKLDNNENQGTVHIFLQKLWHRYSHEHLSSKEIIGEGNHIILFEIIVVEFYCFKVL